EAVQAVLQKLGKSRLVTLVGAGGVGKTRLAIEVAAHVEAGSNGSVVWVELAPLTDIEMIVPTLAAAIGIRQEGATDPGALLTRISSQLSGGEWLLAMDNCEHLLDGVAVAVQDLLMRCPDLRVIASSRERLGLTGEIVWRVPSLPVPDPELLPADSSGAAEAFASPAVQLFCERASSAENTFELSRREDIEAVCRICQRLDGIPLAIELAAARVRSLTVQDIHNKLDQRFRLLTGGSSAVLPRHRTLRSLIDWS